jgi:hypothetical protein
VSSLIAHLQELVHQKIGGIRGIVRRKALASDGWFVGGSLVALVNRDARIVVKLTEKAAQDELLAIDGAEGWRIGKKAPMRAWILLPESMHDDDEALGYWLKRAIAAAAAPPAPRRKRAAAPKTRRRRSR